MSRKCPYCEANSIYITKYGFFVRRSDKKTLRRFLCGICKRHFSDATFHQCYRQKKRLLNPRIREFLCSGVSQRRIAILLKISRTTVARKLIFLAQVAREKNLKDFLNLSLVSELQFDDLETIEHTKCKPLSVTMAVEKHSRRILGFEISKMPAKGMLVKIAR